MGITKKEQCTISYYNDNAKNWINRFGPDKSISFWTEELKIFQSYVHNKNIFEIGFGCGKEAAFFIHNGYTYTGIDAAGALVDIMEKKLPNAQFIENSAYDFDLPANSFDGFWCSAVLLHIPKENIDIVLQKIKYVMKPGAMGFISLAEGDGEYFDEATQRYFYLYTEDVFIDILQKNGFIIEKQAIKKHETSMKWLQTWLTFFVRV